MFLIQFTPTDIRTYIYTYVGGYDTNIRKLFHVDFYYSSHLDLTNLHMCVHMYVCMSVDMTQTEVVLVCRAGLEHCFVSCKRCYC